MHFLEVTTTNEFTPRNHVKWFTNAFLKVRESVTHDIMQRLKFPPVYFHLGRLNFKSSLSGGLVDILNP